MGWADIIELQALASASQECVLFVMGWHKLPMERMALAVQVGELR